MSSKEEGPDRPEGLTGLGGPNGPDGVGRRTRARPGQRELTDPAVMRALSHPLRLSLLEELIHAGTLTATQAGEILGETPANCAFHLRTLARYGLVEEAGGGKGRERPWRRAVTGFNLETTHKDPQAAAAAGVLDRVWTDRTIERARASLGAKHSWPPEWRGVLGESQSLRYLTLAEAAELQDQLRAVLDRFIERNDNPAARPPGAVPVEMLLLSYPVLHLASRGRVPPG
jgi:DNA-binding transcriptional ArsR family regulator